MLSMRGTAAISGWFDRHSDMSILTILVALCEPVVQPDSYYIAQHGHKGSVLLCL